MLVTGRVDLLLFLILEELYAHVSYGALEHQGPSCDFKNPSIHDFLHDLDKTKCTIMHERESSNGPDTHTSMEVPLLW